MMRKLFLALAAIALTFALTAFSGYMLYTQSDGRTDASLSVVVRLVINPMIVILIGAFVGRFSLDRPVPVAILGILPWAFVVLSNPRKPTSMSAWACWVSLMLIHL